MKGSPLISHFWGLTYFLSLGKGQELRELHLAVSQGHILYGKGSTWACSRGWTTTEAMEAVLGKTGQSRGSWKQKVIDAQEYDFLQ